MIIYIDLVFLINLFFDLLLLLTINIALKRYAKIFKIFIASLLGSITLISLFISFNFLTLLLLKLVVAYFMCLIAFGYKNIKYTLYNLIYLYMTSMILGGFIYYLKENNIPYLIILIISPFILYIFIKSIKETKKIKNYYYQVKIIFMNNYEYITTGFLDTGNKLKDPISKKPIILINKRKVKGKIPIRSPMYIPYNTINNHSLLECIKVKKIYISDKEIKGYLVGLSEYNFKLNGAECLLNYQILEDINV